MSDANYTAPVAEKRSEGEGWILCRDPRLARLLETELAYLGVSAASYAALPLPSEGVSVLVADGDEFGDEACITLAAACGCPLLLFGREERELAAMGSAHGGGDKLAAGAAPSDSGEQVAFLRRPFALSALEKNLRRLLPDALYARPTVQVAEAPPKKPSPPPLPALSAADGVVTVGDHTVTLTPAEWQILEYLMNRAGQTVPREELSALLGGGGNIVDVYVCRLRAKIEKPLGRRMIRTVRGVGYVMSAEGR